MTRAARGWVPALSRRETLIVIACAIAGVWGALFSVVLRQPLLGGDFVQFYTFGTLARTGDWAVQYDWPAFHQVQTALVSASAGYYYPPSYPPLVQALYAPLALAPFPVAFALWTMLSATTYGGLILLAADAHPRRWDIVGASLIFPPFAAHVLAGQSTIVPLMGFVGGWAVLRRNRPVLAGLVLSVVAVKPHFGVAMAFVFLAMRLWRVIGGIVLGLMAHAGLSVAICGEEAVAAYLATTLRIVGDTTLINPTDARHTHALRMSLEALAPHDVATGIWLAASAATLWMTVRVWRRNQSWTTRMAALMLATLLVSPHVQTYDAILMAPVVLWLCRWGATTKQPEVVFAALLLPFMFVVPLARVMTVPVTVPLMAWLLWRCVKTEACRPRDMGSNTGGQAPKLSTSVVQRKGVQSRYFWESAHDAQTEKCRTSYFESVC
jgi:hypothetical protein